MYTKKLLIPLLILLASFDLNANPMTANWSLDFGDDQDQFACAMAADADGNAYWTGYFEGEIDFGGGPLVNPNKDDIFLAKFDPQGNHLWSRSFGDGFWQQAHGVAVSPDGDVVVTGVFTSTVDFGGGSLVSTGPAGSDIFDVFIAKFDGNGNHLWSQSFGSDGDESATGLSIDGNGNIAVMGDYAFPFTIGSTLLPEYGYWDLFVAVFAADGTPVWCRGMGTPWWDWGGMLAYDPAGNLLVHGSLTGEIDFGGGPMQPSDAWDAYLVKYDSDGSYLWGLLIVCDDTVKLGNCSVDDSGNVFLLGTFDTQIDFGTGPLSCTGSSDVYLAKIAPGGATLWSRTFSGGLHQSAHDGIVAQDGCGIILTGTTTGGTDFGGGPLGAAGPYLTRLDRDGSHLWSQGYYGTPSLLHLAAGVLGELFLSGSFTGFLDLGSGGMTTVDSDYDIFLAHFDQPVTSAGSLLGLMAPGLSVSPNPFNPTTEVVCRLEREGWARLTVHDTLGRLISCLLDGSLSPGSHAVTWSGVDSLGHPVASGTYLLRLVTDQGATTTKVTVAK